FSEGNKIFGQKGAAEAIPFFKRAVELDPRFGLAHTYLGAIYPLVGEVGLSRQHLIRGFELRDRLGTREQYIAAGNYYFGVTGELEKARQQFQLAAQEYPRDFHVRIQLAQLHRAFAQYEQAVTLLREALRLEPDSWVSYNNLGLSYMNLDHLDEA